jgi:hypothetical protein
MPVILITETQGTDNHIRIPGVYNRYLVAEFIFFMLLAFRDAQHIRFMQWINLITVIPFLWQHPVKYIQLRLVPVFSRITVLAPLFHHTLITQVADVFEQQQGPHQPDGFGRLALSLKYSGLKASSNNWQFTLLDRI